MILQIAVYVARLRLHMLNAQRRGSARAIMIDLQAGDLMAVDESRSPPMSEPAGTLEPETPIGLIMPAPGRGSTNPHDAARERIERAFFREAFQRVHR